MIIIAKLSFTIRKEEEKKNNFHCVTVHGLGGCLQWLHLPENGRGRGRRLLLHLSVDPLRPTVRRSRHEGLLLLLHSGRHRFLVFFYRHVRPDVTWNAVRSMKEPLCYSFHEGRVSRGTSNDKTYRDSLVRVTELWLNFKL